MLNRHWLAVETAMPQPSTHVDAISTYVDTKVGGTMWGRSDPKLGKVSDHQDNRLKFRFADYNDIRWYTITETPMPHIWYVNVLADYGRVAYNDALVCYLEDYPIKPSEPSPTFGWISPEGHWYPMGVNGHDHLAVSLVYMRHDAVLKESEAREALLADGWCMLTQYAIPVFGATFQNKRPKPTKEQIETLVTLAPLYTNAAITNNIRRFIHAHSK